MMLRVSRASPRHPSGLSVNEGRGRRGGEGDTVREHGGERREEQVKEGGR